MLEQLIIKKILGKTLDGMIAAGNSKVRKWFMPEERRKALQDSLVAALIRVVKQIGPQDKELQEDYVNGLFHVLDHDDIYAACSELLNPKQSFDPKELNQALSDRQDVLPDMNLDSFSDIFLKAFLDEVQWQKPLQGYLNVAYLATLVDQGRLAFEQRDEIKTHLAELCGYIRDLVEDRAQVSELDRLPLGQAQRHYQALNMFLNGQGYQLLAPDPQSLTIRGEKAGLADPVITRANQVAATLRQRMLVSEPQPDDLRQLRDDFLADVVERFKNLTFRGLMRTPKPIVLPLADIYVDLRCVAEVPESADTFSIEERRLLLEQGEGEHRDEVLKHMDVLRRERWSRTLTERRSIAEALHRPDRRGFVILGDPGSGKTTFLHFLALAYARGAEEAAQLLRIPVAETDRLPIYVPLAAYDDQLKREPDLSLQDFLPRYYDRYRGLPGLAPLFQEALESGSAILLLDGLDEVLDRVTRLHVADLADALITRWQQRGNRVVVTSRFVGYREAPLSGARHAPREPLLVGGQIR